MFSHASNSHFTNSNNGEFQQKSTPFIFGQHTVQQPKFKSAFTPVNSSSSLQPSQFTSAFANRNDSSSNQASRNGSNRGRNNSKRGRGRGGFNSNGADSRKNTNGSESTMNNINFFQRDSQPALAKPPLLPSPSGFRQRQRSPVSTPEYLQSDQKLITSITRQSDPWDLQNQNKMLELEKSQYTSNIGLEGIYRDLQAMRDVERKEMENRGLVDQQDTRKDLKDAIIFVGSCVDKCPTFERVRRAFEKDTKSFEKVIFLKIFFYFFYFFH